MVDAVTLVYRPWTKSANFCSPASKYGSHPALEVRDRSEVVEARYLPAGSRTHAS
jgi:hypothetical protein